MFSFDLWSEIEEETGATLLVKTGLINFGKCNKSGECEDDYLLKHMGILAKAGKPCEWLTPQDIKRLATPDLEPILGYFRHSSRNEGMEE